MTIHHVRKFVAAVIGTAALAIALHADDRFSPEDWLAIGTSFAAAIGVYVVPNTSLPSRDPATGRFVRRDGGQAYLGLVVIILLLVIILLATGRL